MKKIVKVLISRLFITVLLILLQFGYLFYLLLEVGKMSTYINLILNILAFIVALFVVNRRMNPAYRLAWVFIILSFRCSDCCCTWYLEDRNSPERQERK